MNIKIQPEKSQIFARLRELEAGGKLTDDEVLVLRKAEGEEDRRRGRLQRRTLQDALRIYRAHAPRVVYEIAVDAPQFRGRKSLSVRELPQRRSDLAGAAAFDDVIARSVLIPIPRRPVHS